MYTTGKAALYGFGRVGRYLVLEIAGSAATLITTAAVLATGSTWYLIPFVIGYTVFVAGAVIAVRPDTRGSSKSPSRADRREILAYTSLACAGTLASAGFLQGTQLMAARFAAPVELAFFAAAVTLITPMYFLPRALALALFPFLSEAHGAGDVEVVRRHTDAATRALLALLAPIFVPAVLLAAEVLVIFGGRGYAEGAFVFQMVLAAAVLAVIQVPSVNALSSGSGLQLRTPVGWAVAGCLVGLTIVAFIGGPLGAAGVSLAYLIGTAITAVGPVVVVWRRYRMPWAGPIFRSLVSVVIAVVLARVLSVPRIDRPEIWLRDAAIAVAGIILAIVILRGDILRVLRVAGGES